MATRANLLWQVCAVREKLAPRRCACERPLIPVPDDKIQVGVVGAPHGVRGEVRLRSFMAEPSDIGRRGPLLGDTGRPFVVRVVRRIRDDMLIARIEGVDDRDAAAALNGTALFMRRADLPAAAEGEFYHADLVGLRALDSAGGVVGQVVAVLNHGGGDLLEVSRNGAPSLLVSFTEAFVPVIDIGAGHLTLAAAALAVDDDE